MILWVHHPKQSNMGHMAAISSYLLTTPQKRYVWKIKNLNRKWDIIDDLEQIVIASTSELPKYP